MATEPLLFWCSGGDVMMRVGPTAVRVDAETQAEILADYEVQRRAAEARGANALSADVAKRASQLTKARMDAGRWARAGLA
jgi:hypothetical protein